MQARNEPTSNGDPRLEPLGPGGRPPSRSWPALLFAFLASLLPGLPVPAAHGLESGTLEPHAPLRLLDLWGREHDLGQLRGKVILVHFWASWCAPCLREMPSLQRLTEAKGGESLAIVAVHVGESELRARAVSQRLGIGFPVLLDEDSATFDRWGATVLPTTYVLDVEGRVRLVGRGPQEWDAAAMIETLASLGAGG